MLPKEVVQTNYLYCLRILSTYRVFQRSATRRLLWVFKWNTLGIATVFYSWFIFDCNNIILLGFHLRFGIIELFAARLSKELMKKVLALCFYRIQNCFPFLFKYKAMTKVSNELTYCIGWSRNARRYFYKFSFFIFFLYFRKSLFDFAQISYFGVYCFPLWH